MVQTIVHGVQHQLRRGTFALVTSFTGAQGEVTGDTTFNRPVLHDGVTMGGFPQSMNSIQASTLAAVTVLSATAVAYIIESASVAVTLPAVNSYMTGQVLTILDAADQANSFNITINTASSADKIYSTAGVASTTVTISIAGKAFQAISNSSNKWVGSMVL